MVPERPDPSPPKYSSNVSKPLLDSESGIENELSLDAPIDPTSANTTTNTVIHAPSTYRRRRKLKRPSRAHMDGRGVGSGDSERASGGDIEIVDIVGHSVQ